jgi:hypothetical protein
VIADPPLPPDTTVIVAALKPAVTVEIVGALGIFAGVIAADGSEVSERPTPLVAVTTNVYAVPFVSPLKMIGEETPDAVAPFDAVTV